MALNLQDDLGVLNTPSKSGKGLGLKDDLGILATEKPSTVKALGLETAKGFTGGLAGLGEKIVDTGVYLGKKTGLGRIGEKIGEKIADVTEMKPLPEVIRPLKEKSQEYGLRAKKAGSGPVTEFLGEAAGGAVPGVAEFAMNVPFAAASGAAEAEKEGKSEIVGGIKGAAERFALGKVLHAISALGLTKRVPAMAAAMGGQQAVDDLVSGRGIKKEEIAKGVGTGVLYGLLPGRKAPAAESILSGEDVNKDIAAGLNEGDKPMTTETTPERGQFMTGIRRKVNLAESKVPSEWYNRTKAEPKAVEKPEWAGEGLRTVKGKPWYEGQKPPVELSEKLTEAMKPSTIDSGEAVNEQIKQGLNIERAVNVGDQENLTGIPGEVGKGKEPVSVEPQQRAGGEEAGRGGILQAQEKVAPLRAAVKIGEQIFPGEAGQTHDDIMGTYMITKGTEERGFLTQDSRFVDRKEGAAIAEEAGIPVAKKGELHSEDLIVPKQLTPQEPPEVSPSSSAAPTSQEAPAPETGKQTQTGQGAANKESILPEGMKPVRTLHNIVNSGESTMLKKDLKYIREVRSGEMTKQQAQEKLEAAGMKVVDKMRVDKEFEKKYREVKVPTNDELFNKVGVPKGNIFADYITLQGKHSDEFSTPEDVKKHVEYVVDKPTNIIPASKEGYTLVVRRNGKDKAAVVEFVLKGGKYRVRSAYTLDEGQLERKIEQAQHGVPKPIPESSPSSGKLDQGGGVSSDTLRAEPVGSSENIISPPEGKVNEEGKGKIDLQASLREGGDATLDDLYKMKRQNEEMWKDEPAKTDEEKLYRGVETTRLNEAITKAKYRLSPPGKVQRAIESLHGILAEDAVKEVERIAASGTEVKVKPKIEIDPDSMKDALKKWGEGDLSETVTIRGMHRTANIDGNQMHSIITLAYGDMVESTPYHEAFHSVQNLLLNSKEQNILEMSFPKKEGISSAERQAEAFADYALRQKEGVKVPSAARAVFDKIKGFFDRLGNALKGNGFQNVEDIFGKAFRGELKERGIKGEGSTGTELSANKSDLEDFGKSFGQGKFETAKEEEKGDYKKLLEKPYDQLTDKERNIVNGLMSPSELQIKKDPLNTKKFLDEDIKPTVKGLFGGFQDLMGRVTRALSPRTGVKKEAVDIAMGMKGQRDKAEFIMERTTQHIEESFNKMKREDQVAFIDRIKTGQAQPHKDLQAVADFMRKTEDALYTEAAKYKPNASWLENHYRVLWKTIPGAEEGKKGFSGLFRKPIQGSKGFFKQHTLNDMSEGLEKGGVPYSYNPMTMWKMAYADLNKFVTAQKMMEAYKGQGLSKFVREFQKGLEGFKKVDDPLFRAYFKPEGLFRQTKEGDFVEAKTPVTKGGEWYMDEGAARLLNNFISRDLVRESAAGRGLLWLKNSTTAMELSLSAFHATFETLETVGSSIGLGLNKIYNRGILRGDRAAIGEGLKDITTALVSPVSTAKLGGKAIKYMGSEEFKNTPEGKSFIKQFPDAAQLMDDLFTGGGKLAMHQDYKINSIRTFKENLNAQNYIGAALRALPAANETLMKPLFEHYIPRLKVGMFLKEYSSRLAQYSKDIESGKMTRAEISRKTWDFVEDRLGEMNFDNLFWNRTMKSSMQLMFRSVTWKLGNIRATGGAFKGQAEEFLNAMKEKRMPELHSNMAWLLGMTATTVALSSAIQYMNTGKMPQETKDFVYPQIDPNDQDVRISTPTYWKDLVSLTHSPLGYAKGSLSSWIGRIADIWQNRDFYGTEVRHEDDPLWKQALDASAHMIPLPFAIQSGQRLRQEGESESKQAAGFLGFTKAPGYLSLTDAEKIERDFMARHVPQGSRTTEQKEHSDMTKGLRAQAKQGNLDPLRDALREEKITPKEYRTIMKDRNVPAIVHGFKSLTVEEGLKVYEAANKEEKEQLKRVLRLKIRNALRNRPTEEREAMREKYKELTGE